MSQHIKIKTVFCGDVRVVIKWSGQTCENRRTTTSHREKYGATTLRRNQLHNITVNKTPLNEAATIHHSMHNRLEINVHW